MRAVLILLVVELAIIAAAFWIEPPRIVEVVVTPTPTVAVAETCDYGYYCGRP